MRNYKLVVVFTCGDVKVWTIQSSLKAHKAYEKYLNSSDVYDVRLYANYHEKDCPILIGTKCYAYKEN